MDRCPRCRVRPGRAELTPWWALSLGHPTGHRWPCAMWTAGLLSLQMSWGPAGRGQVRPVVGPAGESVRAAWMAKP